MKDQFPDVKFILKGIGCGEDAEIAIKEGVWGVYCSNHGGRQLDHGRGSAAVLPEIVEVAKGKAKIIVDGSFSRGTDIVKAICLGADWVGIGRLYCYGLAANGAAGIERVIELLEEEMKEVMGLLGVSSLKQLDKSYISQAMPTNLPQRALGLPADARRILALPPGRSRAEVPRHRRRGHESHESSSMAPSSAITRDLPALRARRGS